MCLSVMELETMFRVVVGQQGLRNCVEIYSHLLVEMTAGGGK
jgi:hypothetical protein